MLHRFRAKSRNTKNESKENDAPRTGTETGKPQDVGIAQEETAREEPPELPKAAKGYVRATYYLNEQRLGAWTDRFDYPINNWGTTTFVRQEEWETWRTAEGGASLPAVWTLRVHIENLTDTPFESARLHLEYDDHGRIETDIMRAGTIPPGEETDLVVPLGRYHIDAPETENPHPTLKLSLFGEGAQEIRGKQTQWSIDLVPSGKKSASDIIEEQTRR